MDNDRDSDEAAFARTLLPLARRWRAGADRAVADFGLSSATGWVLVHVGRLDNRVRQNELADILDIHGATLVRLIDQLQAAGFLAREVDKADRRVNWICLSKSGGALVSQIEGALAAVRRKMFEGIDDRDLKTALDVLTKLDVRVNQFHREATK